MVHVKCLEQSQAFSWYTVVVSEGCICLRLCDLSTVTHFFVASVFSFVKLNDSKVCFPPALLFQEYSCVVYCFETHLICTRWGGVRAGAGIVVPTSS